MTYQTILLDFDDTIVDFMMQKKKHFTIWLNILITIQQKMIFIILER